MISCGKKGDPTLKAYEKPSAPGAFRALHREEAIFLFWNYPKDDEPSIDGFVLLKSKPGDSEEVIQIEKEHRSYVDTDIALQTEYTYTIFSKNLKGVMSDTGKISVLPSEVPLAPEPVSFQLGNNMLKLSWSSTGDSVVYNVYKSSKSEQYGFTPVNVEPISTTYFSDKLDTKKPVYYIVRSLRAGPLRDEGPASEEIKITPADFIPSAPVHLQAVQTKGLIRLIWKEPPETWITSYKIYRKGEKENEYQYIGLSSTPTFLDPDNQLKKRNYRVTAVGPVSEGLPAELENVVLNPIKNQIQ
jgi:hypothetical protein